MNILNFKPEDEHIVVERILIMVRNALQQNFLKQDATSSFGSEENTIITDNAHLSAEKIESHSNSKENIAIANQIETTKKIDTYKNLQKRKLIMAIIFALIGFISLIILMF